MGALQIYIDDDDDDDMRIYNLRFIAETLIILYGWTCGRQSS